MSSKHIFIGIGGAGVSTVSVIKQKVYERYQESGTKTRAEQMNEKYRFLFIDTDPRDINKANERNRSIYESGRVPFIDPQTELVSLAQGNAHAIYEEAKQFPDSMINQRILEACTEELASMIPDQPLALGAGAFRMKSRISFARSMSEFQQKLQAHIEDLNNVKVNGGDDTRIMYWLVSSCLGGTGSGIVNDVLYYINMQHQRSIGDGDPHLVYTMYMPKFYIDKNSTEEKYSANAFAMLSEVEAFKAMSNDQKRNKLFHRLALTKDYNLIDTNSRYDPFYYLIPIDCQTDKGTNVGSAMYNNTAELLFHIHEGNGGDALHSDVDNYMHDLYLQRPKGFLVPMGYIALRKPEEEFDKYIEARFKRDFLVYGLRNAGEPLVNEDDESISKLYEDVFKGTDLQKELKTISDEKWAEKYPESKIKKDDSEEGGKYLMTITELEDATLTKDLPQKFSKQYISTEEIPNLVDLKKTAKKQIKSKLWLRADEMIRERGAVYTFDFFKKLNEYAKAQFVDLVEKAKTEPDHSKAINDAYDEVENYSVSEKISKKKQVEDVINYYNALRNATNDYVDWEIGKVNMDVFQDITNSEGDGILKDLVDYLEQLDRTITEQAGIASKEYKSLAAKVGEKSLDVTSVYLPDLKDICDSAGWKKGSFFSKLYEFVLATTSETVEGSDNKIRRTGEKSLEYFVDRVYGSDPIEKKEIKANYEIDGKTRILANEVKSISNGARASVENFVFYAFREFKNAIKESEEVKSYWYERPINVFFDELSSQEKDRVRQSLRPSLFFNYKGNRIAVDYREFLIFVAPDQKLASTMLGFQDGNPLHKFIKDPTEALVIRAKYGLSFSDYRMYDNIKTIYEKAPFRDKYHFHHYFAEFGESLTIEDLPYEVSPAHRVYAKMLLLKKYQNDINDFFYSCPEFKNRKNDYANFILIEKDGGEFAIARPRALSNKEGKICLTIVEKNAKLFADFEGKTFAEAFNVYLESFVRNSIQETYQNFLREIRKHPITLDDHDATGEDLIKMKFNGYREELLKELDAKIQECTDEQEKKLYRIFFSVIESGVTTYRDL